MLADAGATVVLAMHPHVSEGLEKYITPEGRMVLIVQSLGNFVTKVWGESTPTQGKKQAKTLTLHVGAETRGVIPPSKPVFLESCMPHSPARRAAGPRPCLLLASSTGDIIQVKPQI